MKKCFLLAFAVLLSVPMFAQRYQGDFSISYGVGIGNIRSDKFDFQTVHGYRFNDHLFVGAGLGFISHSRVLPDYDDIGIDPLIFADVKGYLRGNRDHRVSPYISFDVGYAFFNKSIYLNPALGIDVSLGERFGIFLAIGYQHQQLTIDKDYIVNGSYSLSTNLSNINLRLGVNF